jgi:CDP-glycerol glycerophosphotransferase (TagB/SpsB family)
MWKYFVETEFHKNEYKKDFKAKNCIVVGSAKLDNYKNIEVQKSNRKTVIYSPHHSIEKYSIHKMGTFVQNGDFILEFAKKHPEIYWIFRPHPSLPDRLLKIGVKTKEEIEKYYCDWEQLGRISTGADNYYKDFKESDCLITDCISFLSEYLPTKNPVLHLISDKQAHPFNDMLQKIIDAYYKINNNEEFEKIFNEVIIEGNDYLKEKRIENIKYLMIDENKTTAQKIVEYIEKELRIK